MGRRLLETQTSGPSSLLRPVSDVSCAQPHILSARLSSPHPCCLCGLSCTGFDPVCPDSASSPSERCRSLSLPPQLLLMLPPEVPVGAHQAHLHGQPRDTGVSALTQRAQGPMDTGLSLHIPPPPLADWSETHSLLLRNFQWAGASNRITLT